MATLKSALKYAKPSASTYNNLGRDQIARIKKDYAHLKKIADKGYLIPDFINVKGTYDNLCKEYGSSVAKSRLTEYLVYLAEDAATYNKVTTLKNKGRSK